MSAGVTPTLHQASALSAQDVEFLVSQFRADPIVFPRAGSSAPSSSEPIMGRIAAAEAAREALSRQQSALSADSMPPE